MSVSSGGKVGSILYPEELPIVVHRNEILDALRSHQVLVVAGETGSGKSTQLPKMLLEVAEELGFSGWIGHTQPRRIAARSIAERVAEELGSDLGSTVGYAVRFDDRVGKQTRIKLMTDGILLAEVQRDPQLKRYSALIIDEAHERSLNIDFLLGYLRSLLPRRPELKVIITSATIDTERFAQHFANRRSTPAPIISVSGRTYPVEMRYRPIRESSDQVDGIVDAVNELARDGRGDILVFLPGERDIRDTADALGGLGLIDTEIVPLFARLSAAEQHRIFASHKGRRIVLATNIAETSLTVPGIRYVIDPGEVRISRYNQRTKVQRLPIEDVSQASANQRAGRCGRIGPGICIRLYSEDDFELRPEFTDPEITRTNLASVILQMASIGLAPDGPEDIIDFPFVESPDTRNISDGVRLLEELGAVDLHPDAAQWVTDLGRRLARLPVDPRIARMIVAADEWNCLDSVLVIAAALSIQDPREEPSDKRESARQSHARFRHPSSDLLSLLSLWDYANVQKRQRSSGSFRRMCRREFLNHNRLREWQDLYSQLKRVAAEMKLRRPVRRRVQDVDSDAVHRSVLTGLLSQIGMKDESEPAKTGRQSSSGRRPRSRSEYIGARNARFVIAPGSALTHEGPRWVMAGELVETNRLYARTVAPIDPRWIEHAAEHLATYTYTDPVWRADRGTATVVERATLYGLPIVPGRTINLHRVDPELARDVFIQGALVDRDWEVPEGSKLHAFLSHNRDVLAEAARWESKTRNRSLEVEAETVTAHYDRLIPAHVVSVRHFEKWWKGRIDNEPALLDLSLDDLLPAGTRSADFPDRWSNSGARLGYVFEPGDPADGMTVTLTAAELRAGTDPYSWLVPGHRLELVTELLRTLPKDTRTRLIPLPSTAARIVDALPDWPTDNTDIAEAVRPYLVLNGVAIEPGLLKPDDLPTHLRPIFRVVDATGTMIAAGRDPERLAERLDDTLRSRLEATSHPLERSGLTEWTEGDIPRTAHAGSLGAEIEVYPALVDQVDSVDLRVLATIDEQEHEHWLGVRRLIRFRLDRPVRQALKLLSTESNLALVGLANSPEVDISRAGVIDDLVNATIDIIMTAAGGAPWTATDMRALVRFARLRFESLVQEHVSSVSTLLTTANAIVVRLGELEAGPVDLSPALLDSRAVLRALVFPGSLTAQGLERTDHIVRYLEGLQYRLDQLPADRDRDLLKIGEIRQLETEAIQSPDLEIGWMIQELRVSLWAQHLGTDGPISAARIRRRIAR